VVIGGAVDHLPVASFDGRVGGRFVADCRLKMPLHSAFLSVWRSGLIGDEAEGDGNEWTLTGGDGVKEGAGRTKGGRGNSPAK